MIYAELLLLKMKINRLKREREEKAEKYKNKLEGIE